MSDFTTAPVFDSLSTWLDDEPRTGVMNMAIDQLLMEGIGDTPLLRVYGWSEPTVSFGYFTPLASAKGAFPESSGEGLKYVRRWTGGGVVDHRDDMTYTLVIPRSHPLASSRGAGSYEQIHQFLALALTRLNALDGSGDLGEKVQLLQNPVSDDCGGCSCFTSPVQYDLLGKEGQKIAGAGQKRTRQGLLHQGSLSLKVDAGSFIQELAEQLSKEVSPLGSERELGESFLQDAERLAAQRYAGNEWLEKK